MRGQHALSLSLLLFGGLLSVAVGSTALPEGFAGTYTGEYQCLPLCSSGINDTLACDLYKIKISTVAGVSTIEEKQYSGTYDCSFNENDRFPLPYSYQTPHRRVVTVVNYTDTQGTLAVKDSSGRCILMSRDGRDLYAAYYEANDNRSPSACPSELAPACGVRFFSLTRPKAAYSSIIWTLVFVVVTFVVTRWFKSHPRPSSMVSRRTRNRSFSGTTVYSTVKSIFRI